MSEIQHQFVKKILTAASHGAYEKGYGAAQATLRSANIGANAIPP